MTVSLRVQDDDANWKPVVAASVSARTEMPVLVPEQRKVNKASFAGWVAVCLAGAFMLVIASYRMEGGQMFSPLLWFLAWPVMFTGYVGIIKWAWKWIR